jgi:cyclic pyranopterin phosphate synthase
MAEKMTFLPRADLLSLEELGQIAALFVRRGVRHVRLTGGEPLVRPGVQQLVRDIARLRSEGLEEVTLTTNGTQLAGKAADLFSTGIRRINISLDTLQPERFQFITRRGELGQVLDGIEAARAAGMRVRINMVALRGLNEDEIVPMLRWCGERGFDLCLIEAMPMGEVEERRSERFLPLDAVRRLVEETFTLARSLHGSAGPARYFDVVETGTRLGFISPLTNNFCAGCNRVRVTATGTIYGCLGQDQKVELGDVLRRGNATELESALDRALAGKPERHDFEIHRDVPAVQRHMSVTGG